MIVFLNGPFGVGKTTTARLLVKAIPGARLYNPEVIGTGLRAVMHPFRSVEDYQDLTAWRLLVPAGAWVMKMQAIGPLVMPMTVWRREHLQNLTQRLRSIDSDVRYVQLTASAAVLRGRILGRPEEKGGHRWCLAHLQSGLAMADDPAFGLSTPTDGRSPAEVADMVRELLGLPGRPV